MAMEIGLLTPPVGLNVYGTQAAAEKDVSIEDVFRGSTPFFLLALLAMILMIAFPAISTTLPSLMILK
jgi:TRAP-type C4-dicarboxylate transport system permease large subunit